MRIRLLEIELGASDPEESKLFYGTVLGFQTVIDDPSLKVFNTGIKGVDFNKSTHLPPKAVVTSFLTDDLQVIEQRLQAMGILYEGPKGSHLGMVTITFTDPDGHLIRVNQPTASSPEWLKV